MLASSIKANAQQGIVREGCDELFFSEIYLEHNAAASTYSYAIEIYNPTNVPIDLDNYSLEITNKDNSVISIFLDNKVIDSGGVFVLAYEYSNGLLLALADSISPLLNFDGALMLDLKHSGNVIDRIGQPTISGIDSIQLGDFFENPFAYLEGIGVNISNLHNIDLRRSYFVKEGNPNFSGGVDLIGKWAINWNDMSDIGQHNSVCRPSNYDVFGFWTPEHTFYTYTWGQEEILNLNVNGSMNLPANNSWFPLIKMAKVVGTATICNNGNIADPDIKWVYGNTMALPNSCESHEFNYDPILYSVPIARTWQASVNNNPKCITLELSSTDPDVVIDQANRYHTICLKKPLSIIESSLNGVNIYPTIVKDLLFVNSVSTKLEYRIISITGESLDKGSLNTGQSTLSLKDLVSGMYIFEMYDSSTGYSRKEKIIKQ